jgi:acetylornithine deacetylase/succinyl-diaminopimelate desuccinylase-like protein
MLNPRRGQPAALLLAVLLLPLPAAAHGPAMASDFLPGERLERYADLAQQWMQEYLQVDTTNPPGNELRAAEFFQRILEAEGIETRLFEYAPGRANLWARVRGNGTRRPLILLNHTDVVGAEPGQWTAPPFSGRIVGEHIYGRGAQDMKGQGLAHLVVMVMLQREAVVLDRDVIFVAVADEEVDGAGTDWMIANQRELLGGAEFLINEGGANRMAGGQVRYVGVNVAEKAAFWLRLSTQGRPGHGSRPLENAAPDRLVRALNRILSAPSELKVLPVAEESLRELAALEPPERARQYRNLRASLRDPRFRRSLESDPNYAYMLRNTIQLTRMGTTSPQTNVIPGEAWAYLDVRLLPGEDPQQFLAWLRGVVSDPQVKMEPEYAEFRLANASPTDTALYQSFRRVAHRYWEGAPVVPYLSSGYTESQRYRELGIHSYGFNPYAATEDEGRSAHGHDERIRVDEVRRGFRVLFDVVVDAAGRK